MRSLSLLFPRFKSLTIKEMNVLITGATGFIGNHVIETILREGKNISITATSRSIDKAKSFSWYNKVNYIGCDLSDKTSVQKLMRGIDLVIHLAWDGLPNYGELFHIEKNVAEYKRSGDFEQTLSEVVCFD